MVEIAETFGSLSIDMVEVEDQEAKDTGAPVSTWTDSEQLDFHQTPSNRTREVNGMRFRAA